MRPPNISEIAPDFRVLDANHAPRTLAELCADGPLVLVFYRGHWCPFCVRQLGQYRDRFRELAAHGVRLAAISVDEPERSRALAEQLELPFPLLCDPTREVVKSYGLLNAKEKGGIAYPATFVIDRDRRVRFRSLDRTAKRLDLDGLFAFLASDPISASPSPKQRTLIPHARDWLRTLQSTIRFGLRSPDPCDPHDRVLTHAARAAIGAILLLVLTAVHHVYGAYVYDTPWRLHAVHVAGVVVPILIGSLVVARKYAANLAGTIALVLLALVALSVATLVGLFEGGYNHVLKNALYFAGLPLDTMHQLFPPPTYELPNDLFFEITGVLQLVPAFWIFRDAYRLLRDRRTGAAWVPGDPHCA